MHCWPKLLGIIGLSDEVKSMLDATRMSTLEYLLVNHGSEMKINDSDSDPCALAYYRKHSKAILDRFGLKSEVEVELWMLHRFMSSRGNRKRVQNRMKKENLGKSDKDKISFDEAATLIAKELRQQSKSAYPAAWYDVNEKDPYPTNEQKVELVEKTSLSLTQVNTWFKNKRRVRAKK